jgi:hypothetical protein
MDTSYYTDLLVNGVEQSQEVSPTSCEPPNHVARSTAKSCQGRSKNFREEEDILLVSAWLNVGMDPIQGADQTQGTFWKRIHAYFHEHKTFKFESTRSESSLMNRWSGIQHDVNLFCGYLSKIETKHHSGWTIDDKVTTQTHNLSSTIICQYLIPIFTLVQMCRLQVHVLCSQRKTRRTGSLHICIAGEFSRISQSG